MFPKKVAGCARVGVGMLRGAGGFPLLEKCWFLGCWFLGFLVSKFIGVKVSRFQSVLVAWFPGSLARWLFRFLGFFVSKFQCFKGLPAIHFMFSGKNDTTFKFQDFVGWTPIISGTRIFIFFTSTSFQNFRCIRNIFVEHDLVFKLEYLSYPGVSKNKTSWFWES